MVTSGTIEVLHIDGDPDITELTATFLHRETEQIDVQTMTSASEGLTAIAQNGFDCIVSDYEMPGQDGIVVYAKDFVDIIYPMSDRVK